MVDPQVRAMLNRLPAQTPKRSGGHLCVAITSIAQLICALWELLIGRESEWHPALPCHRPTETVLPAKCLHPGSPQHQVGSPKAGDMIYS